MNKLCDGSCSYLEAIILILIGFGIGIFFVYAIFQLSGTIDKINTIHTDNKKEIEKIEHIQATINEWEIKTNNY